MFFPNMISSITILCGTGRHPTIAGCSPRQMINTEEYLAEPALWVKAWRYQGHLQAEIIEDSSELHVQKAVKSVDQF